MSPGSRPRANRCLDMQGDASQPQAIFFFEGTVPRYPEIWVTWAAQEPLTFHVSQAKVGELRKVDKGHDSTEDGSRCRHHVTFHLQTLPAQQHHTEVPESQVGFPFFGLKTTDSISCNNNHKTWSLCCGLATVLSILYTSSHVMTNNPKK